MGERDWYQYILVVIIVVCVVLVVIQNVNALTGRATEITTSSNVTIVEYLAIDGSTELDTGISFGTVSQLPITDQNATQNGGGGITLYWINVSQDGNTAVDFCIKGNDDLENVGADIIGLGNESYNNATTTDAVTPTLAGQVPLTVGYVKAGVNVGAGSSNYYRFWLDVPASTATGSYNNTLSFKGVSTGGSC